MRDARRCWRNTICANRSRAAVIVAVREEILNLCGQSRFGFGGASRSLSGERNLAAGSVDRSLKCRASRHRIVPTHGYDYAGLSFTNGYGDSAGKVTH